MKKIEGSPKNLKQLLQNTKYSIHYYQREYMWQRKHIEELIDDLTSEFLEYYKTDDPRQAVADYGAYFMGSIVLAGRENAIIDGQQRFSSLTLLLMYLNNRLKTIGQSYNMIETMIFSEFFGTKSFNINVDDRQDCMNAIFNDTDFDTTGAGESVKNLYGRYQDIQDVFPADITDDMLLHFCDWVAEKVFFIEIVATTEQDAHKVFVTMNDRSLSLTSTEMLKGYILSEIKSDSSREKMNGIWKDKVLTLKKDDDKGDETFINNIKYRSDINAMNPIEKNVNSLEDYIKLTKASRYHFCLDSEVYTGFLKTLVNAKLRNAIGHNDVEYNSVDQLITYIPNPKDRTKKKTEYLLQFENEAMHMFQAILGISEYLYRLRELELMYDGKIPIMVQERVKWPKKIGRNELCPCGSGKKYKRCHGR